MSDVFISYAHEDRPIAVRLAEDLSARGSKVFFDRDLVPGEEWSSRLAQELKRAKYVLVILSPSYVRSPSARRELEAAARVEWEGHARIIPVMAKETEIPLFLQSKHYADIRRDYQAGLNSIQKALSTSPGPSPEARKRASRRTMDLLGLLTSLLAGASGVVASVVSDKAIRFAPSAWLSVAATAAGLTALVGALVSAYKPYKRSEPARLTEAAVERAYIDALDHSSLNPLRAPEET
jgi:hypothetical protein